MVNTTQFYKTKVALAVVLSLGLAACGDTEGDAGSTSTSTSNTVVDATQNEVASESDLTGTVQGVVVDSNGNPLEGVMVYLGDAETTTNAGGQYTFSDVAVTNVSGVNNEGGEVEDSTTSTLIITIGGTDAYLGALVTVTPEAQVNNTGGTGVVTGTNSDTTIQTFIDGFTAQAGTATLPLLNAGAYGYVRDCATGQTLAETADLFSLDFVSLSATEDTAVGEQTTISENNVTFGADENGEFSITGLAANSTYSISAKEGWKISGGDLLNSDDDTFTTNSEGSSAFLQTIEVCPVDFTAVVTPPKAPYIKSINGQIGTSVVGVVATGVALSDLETTAAIVPPATVGVTSVNPVDAKYAALTQGVVNDFVINFSEEMASVFDMSEARVKVIAPGSSTSTSILDATVALSTDGKSATVTFATDLAEGSKVDVWFPHWIARDANDDLYLVDNNAIVFDSVGVVVSGSDKAFYSHAYFCTFSKPGNEASVLLSPQVFDADTTEDGGSADLAGYSTAFQDNYDNTTGLITQLNDGDSASGTRLAALALARGTTVTVDQDYAVVEFDDSAAASLIWDVNGTPYTSTGTTVTPASSAFTIVMNGSQKEAHFDGVAHNHVVSVTPVNGFGDVIAAGKVSVTVVDAIAPTTVLQESYNITDTGIPAPRSGQDVVSSGTANASFGNGGEISAPGTTATAAGEPIIHIQPRHLAGQTNGADDRNNEFNSLVAGMSARLTTGEIAALGGSVLAQTAISSSVIVNTATERFPIYDATAYAGWTAIPATIGVAFNENVTLTTTPPSFGGSTTLSGYTVLNNVAVNVDGQPSLVDLVTFDTADVLALSLDAGADLGFVGSVTDSRANVSTANAQVFIQDTFPPMMTAAVWNGDTLVLTFNEAPVVTTGIAASITVINPASTATAPQAIPVTIGNTGNAVIVGNVMTISLTSGQNVLVANNFVAGANNEFAYNDDASTTNNLPEGEHHALISWDNIADATGNQWSEFTPAGRGIETAPANTDVNRWEVVAPRFLAVDAVGVFSFSVEASAYNDVTGGNVGDTDGTVVYTITFTHPIKLDSSNPFSDELNGRLGYTYANMTGAITANTATPDGLAILQNLFVVDIDGSVSAQVTTFDSSVNAITATEVHGALTISADHKVITLTVEGVADVTGDSITFGTTTIGFLTTTTSAITGSLTSSGNFPWQNNN